LAKGERAHPANYRGCRYAKEEMQKGKSQRTPKTTMRRVFSKLATSGMSFAAALRGSTEQEHRPQTCHRIQWCSIRGGDNSGHYKNCLKFHAAK
jgi:hypothetical protein